MFFKACARIRDIKRPQRHQHQFVMVHQYVSIHSSSTQQQAKRYSSKREDTDFMDKLKSEKGEDRFAINSKHTVESKKKWIGERGVSTL